MIPPFEHMDFVEMRPLEAKKYFEWYVGEITNRIAVLSETFKNENNLNLDYSIDSLIDLWEWYETKITYRSLGEAEYKELLDKYPAWMYEYISKTDLSYETLAYGMDIAIYFAEVIIRNNTDRVRWGYFTKPKNRASVNEPVLLGFKYDKDLNPRLIIINCARKSERDRSTMRLYDMYNVWMKYL